MTFQVPPVRTTSVHPSDWTHPLPAIKISFYSSLEPQGYHVAKVLRSAIAALGFLVIVAIKRLGDKMVISKTHAGGIRLGLRNRKIRCRKYKVYIYIYIYIIHDLLSICQLVNLPPVFFLVHLFPWDSS